MGRQRFNLPNARGRLFQPLPAPVTAVPSIPQVLTPGLDKRLLQQSRGRITNYVARPSARQGPVVDRVLRRTQRLLPSTRGRITNYVPFASTATTGPLVGQVLRPRLQPLRYSTRNRIITWVLPNNVPPPFQQSLPPSVLRTSERLLLRPARGRIFDAHLIGQKAIPVWAPQILVTRRAPVYPRRYGHIQNFIAPISTATIGPVAITLIRQAGTDNHVLRIRRGAVVSPPWPAIPPPPPPPPPGQGTDDDVGASLGRRKWHWKHRAVKTSLPKSLVWDWIN